MKNLSINSLQFRSIIITFLCTVIFSGVASARKFYISKFADNGYYANGAYAPGDTLVLRASLNPFTYFSLENIHGSSSAPIVIMNEGGQVRLERMEYRHCTWLKVSGTGSSDTYGFYITNPTQSWLGPGVSISGRSSDMEVDHLDINDIGYGFWVKEEGSCIDSLQYPNWRLNNFSIHDNRMQNLKQEGIYAGSTAPNGERGVVCNGVTTYPLPMRLGNFRIYNNIIYHTVRGGIQLSAADYGTNEIYGNTVSNCGYEYVANQGNGIILGSYTTAYVHDNTVDNTYSTGIFSLGAGLVRIENNRVDHSGQLEGHTASGSASIMVDTRLTTPTLYTTFYVKNNTVGTNSDVNVRVYDTYPTYTQGNIICNNISTSGTAGTVYVQGITDWSSCTSNQSPTANAGQDQTITLPASSVQLYGSATDADGTIASYVWSVISGPSGSSFTMPSSAQTGVTGLVAGSYTFRLKVTDNAGYTGTDDIVVTVTSSTSTSQPSSGSSRIEAENYSSMNGIQTENTSDAGGGLNVGWQDNNDWMDYSVNISSAGTYTVNFRVASMFSGAQFQLRNGSGNVLTTVTVPNTGSFQTWQTVSAQVNLPSGQQTLRIYTSTASGGWNINWWEIQAAARTTDNQAPQVNAGSAQTISLPTTSVQLNGSATDADGTIASYKWSQVTGPSTALIGNSSSASTSSSGLIQGSYTFRLTATDNGGATGSADVTITVNSTSTTTSSTHIEAENYTSMSGIQTESTSDAGGGLNVGWQDDNDWMDYSVNVPATGTYTLNFRVASMFKGALFELRNASGTSFATVTVPNTGSFQTWQTVSAQVSLPAGQQTLRIYTTRASGGWNINWWEIQGSTIATQPTSTKIEAETYTSMNGIQTENTSDAGGGLNVGWQDNNDWMDYSVNISSAGSYTVNFRVASMFSGAQFQLRNSSGSVLTTVTVPNTGSFQTWQTVSAQVSLPSGQQTLRIYTTSANGGWNINWWEIVPLTTAIASVGTAEIVDSSSSVSSVSIFPNPVTDRFALKVSNSLAGSMNVQVIDMSGVVRKTFALVKQNSGITQTYLSIGGLTAGQYIVKVTMSNWTDSVKIIKQ